MTDRFVVDLAQLEQVVADMAVFDGQAEQWCAEVDRRINALQLGWSGEGAAAQRAAHEPWLRGAARMRSALDQLRTAAHGAHGNYTAAVQTNQAMWP